MKKTEANKTANVIKLATMTCMLFLCSINVQAIEKTLIFPIPQQILVTNDIFVLDGSISIIVPPGMSKNNILIARFLVRELSDKYGIALKIEPRTDIPKDGKTIIMEELGFKDIIPIQYGVNILEWNPWGESRIDKTEGDTGAAQDIYCYQAEPVSCSFNSNENPITFFAFEWVTKVFGKK